MPVLARVPARASLDGDVVIVAPDAGGGKLARRFADRFGADIAFIDKRRPKGTHNVAVATEVVGEIEGRTCVIVDDMIDTAGTVVSAADLLVDRGATRGAHRRDPRSAVGPGGRPAEERADPGGRRHQHGADPDEKRFDSLKVLSIAPLLADAIDAVFDEGSVSELFDGDNV